jgi:hypothetical protein
LGTIEELPTIGQKKVLALRINELVKQSRTGMQALFVSDDPAVEALAQKCLREIMEKDRLDLKKGKNFQRIDTDTIVNKDVREVGAEWMNLQALQQLQVDTFKKKPDGCNMRFS